LDFYRPLFFPKKQTFWRVVLAGIIFSVFIEGMQFLLETGVTDIDDVFFNSCGTVIGYFCYWLVMIIRRKTRKTN